MPAEYLPERLEPYEVVYILPPWAERRPTRRTPARLFARFWRSETAQTIRAEIQFLVVVGVIGWCLCVIAPDLYRLKCQAGIDLLPGIHAPDVFPSLAGR